MYKAMKTLVRYFPYENIQRVRQPAAMNFEKNGGVQLRFYSFTLW